MSATNGNGHSLRELIGGLSLEVQGAMGKLETRMGAQELMNLQQQEWLTKDPDVVGFVREVQPAVNIVKGFGRTLRWATITFIGAAITVAASSIGSCRKSDSNSAELAAALQTAADKQTASDTKLASLEAALAARDRKLEALSRNTEAARRSAQASQALQRQVAVEVKKVAEEVGVPDAATSKPEKRSIWERLLP